MEGLKVSNSNMVVHIHPSKTANISDAILHELSSLLFTYNEQFDGVVLAYEIIGLDNSGMKILTGLHPYVSVRFEAKLFLFSPKPDMILEGKVAKVTQGSIHLVVLGFASAVIGDEDIRNEFEYKIKHGEERFYSRFHKRHVIKVGEIIRFLVKSFDEDILHITGSLVPPQTGSVLWLAKNLGDETVVERSNLKRENEAQSTLLEDHGTISGEPLSVNNEQHRSKKSKKAKRHREES